MLMLMLAEDRVRGHTHHWQYGAAAVGSLLIMETRVKGWHFEVIRGLVLSAQLISALSNTSDDGPLKPFGALLRRFSSFELVALPAPF